MKIFAYITCPSCGHHISSEPATLWQLALIPGVLLLGMIVAKFITGKWLP